MELRDVETFLVLSEELHFGRAATRLRVTQGRVSQTIRALEREIGGRLFERTSRRVRLTALGHKLGSGARPGYDELARSLRDCQDMARGIWARLRLGYTPTIGAEFAFRVAAAFESRHPGSEIRLNVMRTVRPDIALDNDEADVILAWSPGGDGHAMRGLELAVGPILAEVQRGLLVPAGHPLTAKPEVSLEDLPGYELLWPPETLIPPDICDLWTPRITPSGIPLTRTPDDLITMTGRDEVLADDVLPLVARGRGLYCTVISLQDRIPFTGLTVLPISDMPPMVVVPVWPATTDHATIRAFADSAGDFRPAIRHGREPAWSA